MRDGMRRVLTLVAVGVLAGSVGALGLLATSAGAGAPTVPVTISKTVVGTDPGVAFPITLDCFSEGLSNQGDGAETTDVTIPNDGAVSETVDLRNGESATIQVTLPPMEPAFAGCSVTEELSNVPPQYSCEASIVPGDFTLYEDGDGPDSVEVAVTNSCALSVEAINFTG
jgi:hypothetical protein